MPGSLPEATVAGLTRPWVRTIAADRPFSHVVAMLLALPAGHDLYVVDRRGHYLGAVVFDRLEPHLADEPHLRIAIASELVDPAIEPVPASLSLSELARQFARSASVRLPVVDASRRLLGTVARIDLALHG